MVLVLGFVSQKGGVGKSTLARLLAREYAQAGWDVKIADLDPSQATSYHWQARRLERMLEPVVAVERFGNVDQALKVAPHYDLLILDGAPHASRSTLEIAEASALTVLPTGLALDDLQPAVLLAHELTKKGIPRSRLAFALCRVGDSETELAEARRYLNQTGYQSLEGEIPEKIAYRRASDEGRALTETRFASLNERADRLAQSIVDKLGERTKERVAHG
jgi:chromosome partitioning protein